MFNRYLFFWKLGVLAMVGSAAAWRLYGQAVPFLHSWPALIVFLLLPYSFTLAHNAIHSVPVWLAKVLAWTGGIWLTFTLYSFFAAVLYAAAALICFLAGLHQLWAMLAAPLAGLSLCAVLLWMACGCWKAFHPVYRTVSLTSYRIRQPLTIAFLTDLHFGPILSRRYARTMVRRIAQSGADVVLLGGDLIDAHLDFVRRDGSYQYLKDIPAPGGVIAVHGNHDYFDSDIDRESRLFQPVRFLRNERLSLTGDIILTGLTDYLHEPDCTVPPAETGKFNILMDHEPLRIAQAGSSGYDLYLGGHTHGGQFFPVTAITRRLFPLSYGTRRFGQLTAVVSSGYGFWGMPMRSGPDPEIVLIRLLPAQTH